jgi:hypothetical protein
MTRQLHSVMVSILLSIGAVLALTCLLGRVDSGGLESALAAQGITRR